MKYLLICVFFLGVSMSHAQELNYLNNIQLEESDDYEKAESDVIKACKYILGTPMDDENIDRHTATLFLLKWMEGCEYMFTIDEVGTKSSEKEEGMLAVYLAAMSKYVLEHKGDAENESKVKLETAKVVADYAGNKANNVRLNRYLKKLIKAKEEGTLKDFLEIS